MGSKLKIHLKNNHKIRHYVKVPCETCGKVITRSQMKRHVWEMHGDRSKKLFKCDNYNCTFASIRRTNLEQHKEICQKGIEAKGYKEYKCQICQEIFPSSSRSGRKYINHCRQVHHDIPPEYKDMSQFMCSECAQIFFDKRKFTLH